MFLKEKGIEGYFTSQKDVEFALLFGSAALNRATPMSDIDIAVYFQGEKDALALGERQIDITCAVMRICKINRVDVIVLNKANPLLRFQALKYGRLIYSREEEMFYKFKTGALEQYQDMKPMQELYNKAVEISLRKGLND